MEIETEEITLNYLTAEKRHEITVRTVDGVVIVFPAAQVEMRPASSGDKEKPTLYAYARKVEMVPVPRVYTLFLEEQVEGFSRHRLEEELI